MKTEVLINQHGRKMFMLKKEQRNKNINFDEHTIVRMYERGIKEKLFPHCEEAKDVWMECLDFLKDENKSVIIEDTRKEKECTHVCMFTNNHGNFVAMPIIFVDDSIHIFSIFDPKKNTADPNWFINRYNQSAPAKGLPKQNLVLTP